MMRYYPSLLLALTIALAAHLALLAAGQRAARRDLGWWLDLVRTPAPTAEAHLIVPPPPPPEEQIGDIKAMGQSINRAPGDVPLQSSVNDADQEQAMMSRDPTGFANGGKQSAAKALQSESPAAAAAAAAQANMFASQESALTAPDAPRSAENAKTPPKTEANQAQPTEAQQQQQAQQPQQAQKAQAADAQDASTPGAKGTPLPSSDFESYPVATIASRFVDGKVEPRLGRRMKTPRQPKIEPAAWADLMTMDHPMVVLRLKIDESGNVADVDVAQTSGSDPIDLACERAAATWWFEPFTDPQTGQPHKQTLDFAIAFR
jgi:TonB family protein